MFNLSLYPYQDCTPSWGKGTPGVRAPKTRAWGCSWTPWAPGRGQEQRLTRRGTAIPPWEMGSYGRFAALQLEGQACPRGYIKTLEGVALTMGAGF